MIEFLTFHVLLDISDQNGSKSIDKGGQKEEEFAPGSPQENEFVSDSFQADDISDEEMRKERQMLGMEEGEEAKSKTEKEEGEALWCIDNRVYIKECANFWIRRINNKSSLS